MWCRSSLSGRADALYVVKDALGSFLLRASEVIDQVPMSACGTFRTWRGVRVKSVVRTKADVARLRDVSDVPNDESAL
jgi:hypothetical protein